MKVVDPEVSIVRHKLFLEKIKVLGHFQPRKISMKNIRINAFEFILYLQRVESLKIKCVPHKRPRNGKALDSNNGIVEEVVESNNEEVVDLEMEVSPHKGVKTKRICRRPQREVPVSVEISCTNNPYSLVSFKVFLRAKFGDNILRILNIRIEKM